MNPSLQNIRHYPIDALVLYILHIAEMKGIVSVDKTIDDAIQLGLLLIRKRQKQYKKIKEKIIPLAKSDRNIHLCYCYDEWCHCYDSGQTEWTTDRLGRSVCRCCGNYDEYGIRSIPLNTIKFRAHEPFKSFFEEDLLFKSYKINDVVTRLINSKAE